MDFNTKTTAEMTPDERAKREQRRAAIRAQILNDQAVNANRDAEALQRESEWRKPRRSH